MSDTEQIFVDEVESYTELNKDMACIKLEDQRNCNRNREVSKVITGLPIGVSAELNEFVRIVRKSQHSYFGARACVS